MRGQEPEKAKKHVCVGLLAHVDAGKTTLAEALLYQGGRLRRLGRVDHKDAFLDTYELERARGITIFSKQAQLTLGDTEFTLLDTPGHVDFAAEMERTLQVLDYAVLVISAADGVQGHVETLWQLLKRYEIPVFLFVNKMDQEGTSRERLLAELKERLHGQCVDFGGMQERQAGAKEAGKAAAGPDNPAALTAELQEELALCDESLLEKYLAGEAIGEEEIRSLIAARKVFPCYFGSALKLWGVEALLNGLARYTKSPAYPEEFGARVYKISRDSQGTRLTHMKITGGSLRVKMVLTNSRKQAGTGGKTAGEEADRTSAGECWEEKAGQIRIYAGAGFQSVEEAPAGSICAVAGLTQTRSGQGLGFEQGAALPLLEPVLTYRIGLPESCDIQGMLGKLRQLEEEEPQLHIVWKEETGEIHAQVMGDVQIEVLRSLIAERFGVEATFGSGRIVYKETITRCAEGIGHFEPLRHYAEAHLWLEPGEPGSGLQLDTDCSEDVLDKNWQRLIYTHLKERRHPGVLTGSEITDMRITVIGGRAHKKHTEGGDFRQATYRAVRQGLKKAGSRLLEPVFGFRLTIPTECLGRAMADLQRMNGSFGPPETLENQSILAGRIPAATLGDYGRQVTAYTGGRGRLSCSLQGYEPCHNEEEVIAAIGYDAEADTDNPTGSVFCAHGAGFVVPWDQVDAYAHADCGRRPQRSADAEGGAEAEGKAKAKTAAGGADAPSSSLTSAEEKELQAIFERTYGPVKRRDALAQTQKGRRGANGSGNEAYRAGGGSQEKSGGRPTAGKRASGRPGKEGAAPAAEEYLLVDGYNIIFAWEELKELSRASLEAARGRLQDILCNYQGYRKMTLILVFDAYKVEGGAGEVLQYHNIYVVYTKEAETADQYIEKTVHRIGRRCQVTVATSDALEQVIILGEGARRISAREFREEVRQAEQEIRKEHLNRPSGGRTYLFDQMEEGLAERMERMRLGRDKGDLSDGEGRS